MSRGFFAITTFEDAIKDGNAYFSQGTVTLNNNGVLELGITIPDNVDITFGVTIIVDTSGPAKFELFEGSAFTAGTGLTANNFNRNSANVATVVVVQDPTVTVEGAQLIDLVIGADGSQGSKAVGGELDPAFALIYQNDTKSLARVTSNASANTVNFTVRWEET